jgi:succinate dehydrogenase flavin-adding protein (antitoxin of CptAB toxin-antitoxin module)
MTKQSKSLTDEIYDEFHQLLKDSKEFDDDILDLLITKGGMRNAQQVIEILKKSMETEK